MIWRNFTGPTALADAQAYCAQQTALMQLPPDSVTKAWAPPELLTDGSYVVAAYQDASAVPWDSVWQLAGVNNSSFAFKAEA